jgi:hypothetical protein
VIIVLIAFNILDIMRCDDVGKLVRRQLRRAAEQPLRRGIGMPVPIRIGLRLVGQAQDEAHMVFLEDTLLAGVPGWVMASILSLLVHDAGRRMPWWPFLHSGLVLDTGLI